MVLAVSSLYQSRCILTVAGIVAAVTDATQVLLAITLPTSISIRPMEVTPTRTVVVVVIVDVVGRSLVTIHLAGHLGSPLTD